MRRDRCLRLALVIVSIGARLVGGTDRERWRREWEWEGELISWWNRAALRPGARRASRLDPLEVLRSE